MKRRGLFAALLGALLPVAAVARRDVVSVGEYAAKGMSDVDAFSAALAEAQRRCASVHVPGNRDWDLRDRREPIVAGNVYSGIVACNGFYGGWL